MRHRRLAPLLIILCLATLTCTSPATGATSALVALDHNGTTIIADVAEASVDSVVNISSTKIIHSQGRQPQSPFFNDPLFKEFFGRNFDVPRDRQEKSLGSGVIVSRDGIILTNNHVVENAEEILVTLADNRELEAEIVGTDPKSDVAVIRLKKTPNDLKPLPIGNSSKMRLGEVVLAIGNPFGLGHTVTMGIISAKGRADVGINDYEDFIQTDAAINPGNSGGALVNMSGQLIGINTAIMSRSGGSQGVGFSIPSNMASRVMEMLVEHGKVRRAWLGVVPAEVDQTMAEALGMSETRGVLMSEVRPDTPAAAAGLREGDIILEVDGAAVNSTSELRNTISLAGVGSDVKLRVLREGRDRDMTVTLGELPDAPVAAGVQREERENAEGIEGVTVRELTERARTQLNIEADVEGVIVTEVAQTSNAWHRGLREGDVITEVAREAVRSLDDFEKLVGRHLDRPVLLKIMRGANVQLVAIPR